MLYDMYCGGSPCRCDDARKSKNRTDSPPPSVSAAIRVLDGILHQPQPLAPTVATIQTCATSNRPLNAFFCALHSDPSLPASLGVLGPTGPRAAATPAEAAGVARRFLTLVMVLDALSVAGRESQSFFSDTVLRVTERFAAAGGLELLKPGSPSLAQFRADSYLQADFAASFFAKATLSPDALAVLEQFSQLSLLAPAKAEAETLHHDSNARVALVLAHALLNRGPMNHVREARGRSRYEGVNPPHPTPNSSPAYWTGGG